MRILELQEYAKENGFNSTKFKFTTLLGEERRGHWIDAHLGLFWIEGMEENNFMLVHHWRKHISDDLIEFEIDKS